LDAFWQRGAMKLRCWPNILKQIEKATRMRSRHARMLQLVRSRMDKARAAREVASCFFFHTQKVPDYY
jgi:hypothetical protein